MILVDRQIARCNNRIWYRLGEVVLSPHNVDKTSVTLELDDDGSADGRGVPFQFVFLVLPYEILLVSYGNNDIELHLDSDHTVNKALCNHPYRVIL